MNLVDAVGYFVVGKLLGELFGSKGSTAPGGEPTITPMPMPKPAEPPPVSPPVDKPKPRPTQPRPPVPKPTAEPKQPLPATPSQVKWPADFRPPAIVDPATGLNEPATHTVPPSRQPNEGKPEPVYVPPQPTKSPDIHKPGGGYTPPQPQVKQTKGEAVTQTEEAAVIARERNPTSAYWMPAKRVAPAEQKAAKDMLAHWAKGRLVFAGPRTFAGRRMFKHVLHGLKKGVEVWQPKPPFV